MPKKKGVEPQEIALKEGPTTLTTQDPHHSIDKFISACSGRDFILFLTAKGRVWTYYKDANVWLEVELPEGLKGD